MSSNALEIIAELRRDAVAQVCPNMIENTEANWQQRKSAQTRTVLMEATLQCLAEHGYSATTTQLVTKTAKVSRGAMLHHFSTKQDLIKNVVEYIFYRRIIGFYDDFTPLTENEDVNEFTGLEVYWESMRRVEFRAYQQIAMASKTDEELRRIFEPQDIIYQRIWEKQLPHLYPGWEGKFEEFKLARDLIETSMLGLMTNFHLIEPRSRRTKLRKLIATMVGQLMRGEINVPEVSKSDIAKTE